MQLYKIKQKLITSFKKERKYEDKNARMKKFRNFIKKYF